MRTVLCWRSPDNSARLAPSVAKQSRVSRPQTVSGSLRDGSDADAFDFHGCACRRTTGVCQDAVVNEFVLSAMGCRQAGRRSPGACQVTQSAHHRALNDRQNHELLRHKAAAAPPAIPSSDNLHPAKCGPPPSHFCAPVREATRLPGANNNRTPLIIKFVTADGRMKRICSPKHRCLRNRRARPREPPRRGGIDAADTSLPISYERSIHTFGGWETSSRHRGTATQRSFPADGALISFALRDLIFPASVSRWFRDFF